MKKKDIGAVVAQFSYDATFINGEGYYIRCGNTNAASNAVGHYLRIFAEQTIWGNEI